MPKKRTHHTSSTKTRANHESESHSHHLEETLIKNIVELQKVHTDLAEKFDHLSKELSKILALFELTARNFAKNAPLGEYEKDKDFLEKMDKLLDQNKLLAKGLTIMEEHLRERMYGAPPAEKPTSQEEFKPSMASRNRQMPHF